MKNENENSLLWCSSDALKMFPWYFHNFISWCCLYNAVMMLPWFPIDALMTLPWCSNEATLMLQDASMMFSWYNPAPILMLPRFFHDKHMLPWCSLEVSKFRWCFHDTCMMLMSYSHDAPMILPWLSYDTPMMHAWSSQDAIMSSQDAQMSSHGAPMSSRNASMMLQWCTHTSMVLARCFHDAPMMLTWCSHDALIVLSLCTCYYEAAIMPSWCFRDAPMVLLCP